MKQFVRWILAVAILAVLLLIGYPQQPKLALSFQANTTAAITLKHLTDTSTWAAWWPTTYAVGNVGMQRIQVQAAHLPIALLKTEEHKTPIIWQVQLFTKWVDTTIVQLFITPEKPIWGLEKIRFYWHTKTIQLQAATVLSKLASFVGNEKNMYGFTAEVGTMTDTILVSNTVFYPDKPTPLQIGEQVTRLRKYLQQIGSKETNYPMLNIQQVNNAFKCKVAIPTNNAGNPPIGIETKFMVLGGTLRAKVLGGPYTIENAMKNYHLYLTDKGLTSPAIPYESMETDRWKQADTSQWKTILYYPIM